MYIYDFDFSDIFIENITKFCVKTKWFHAFWSYIELVMVYTIFTIFKQKISVQIKF